MQWRADSPESAGIPSGALLKFTDALDKYEHVHSFMLIRNGIETAAGWWRPYEPEVPHLLYSLSKSFISCAIGFAIEEKKLTLQTRLTEIFPEYRHVITDRRFEEMTIRHLLTMSTGHGVCSTAFFKQEPDGDFIRDFFTSPLEYAPGERFVYNSGATFMLSAAIRRATGENPSVYLRPRMLDALEIGDRFWEKSPDGTDFGGWGYRLTTKEIASFAFMLLNKGKVGGKQILPEAYLAEAVSKQIDNSLNESPDWKVGYGYQFWRCRHNAFRGDGAFGQYALVLPEENMVLAVTSGGKNMQQILDMVWDILLPALSPVPLAEDPETQLLLKERLAGLAIPARQGKAPAADRDFIFDISPNKEDLERITLSFRRKHCQLAFEYRGREKEIILAGWESPISGETQLEDGEKRPVSATASLEGETLSVRMIFYSTPFISDFTITLSGESVSVKRTRNLTFRIAPQMEFDGTLSPSSTGKDFHEVY